MIETMKKDLFNYYGRGTSSLRGEADWDEGEDYPHGQGKVKAHASLTVRGYSGGHELDEGSIAWRILRVDVPILKEGSDGS